MSTAGSISRARAKSSFCWLPPDSDPAGASRSGEPSTRCERVADRRALGPAADEPEPPEALQAGQADVLADRPAQEQPVVLARLGDQRDAGLDRAAGRAGERVVPARGPRRPVAGAAP